MILFTLFTAVKVLTFMIVAIQKTINHHQLLELAIKMTQKCAPNAEFSGVQILATDDNLLSFESLLS